MMHWARDAVFYHVYPLGLCGAPSRNDHASPPVPRLGQLEGWIEHFLELGVNALYLGPVFESGSHGYDTVDYHQVDRRLGTEATLARLVGALHGAGIRVILDGVFNHVGRGFWAFRDVQADGERSAYRDWFHGLRFDGRSPFGDPFAYEGWNGHHDLVKLDVRNPTVAEHLFAAVESWMRAYDIDGLRLDAADSIDIGFLERLATFCRARRPEFWLMGEVVHGDYRRWANPRTLDSVTNYECYKGLYSSLEDRNYFEIAYALNRQFGEGGLYRDLPLYAFADNHDVNRVASSLSRSTHLCPLYALLFTMPGVPSVYYGSEWGITGRRGHGDDSPLRPSLDLATAPRAGSSPDLAGVIARLARIRRATPALRHGTYRQLSVSPEQFAFAREADGSSAFVLLNAADEPATFEFHVPAEAQLVDALNGSQPLRASAGRVCVDVPPTWARILTSSGTAHTS